MTVDEWKQRMQAAIESTQAESEAIASGLLQSWGLTRIPPDAIRGVALLVQTIEMLKDNE